MKAVIQRVSSASVTIDNIIKGAVQTGLLVFIGIGEADSTDDIHWLSRKIVSLRIFDDENKIPNLSVKDIGGEVLLISQFTLHASVKKGNRPSYIKAAAPKTAIPLYEAFIQQIEKDLGQKIQTGKFGADMKIALVNDGPLTIIIDTKE